MPNREQRARPNPTETSKPSSTSSSPSKRKTADPSTIVEPDTAEVIGERLRQVALGAVAALWMARVYWVSEPEMRADAGTGMTWVAALLVVAGLAIASSLISGRFRVRWSWADAGVIALMVIVGMSASTAIDRRPAINLAWEWGALGFLYVLLRNLPRTPAESKALVTALVTTAVAVAAYGLYQATVEMPAFRALYLQNREAVLQANGISPGTPSAAMYEDRLLGSNEAFATFALPASLAGFLVGPLVILIGGAWKAATARDPNSKANELGGKILAILPVIPLILIVLVCLVLTKSRSSWVGAAAAGLILALRELRLVRFRTMAMATAGMIALIVLITAVGLKTGRLDKEVLTQSGKSLGYRLQYWTGTWTILNSSPKTFWRGLGPGNFVAPYVFVKAPDAGEEIFDPHDIVLEVWATGGLLAVLALSVALGFGLTNLLRPPAIRAFPQAETVAFGFGLTNRLQPTEATVDDSKVSASHAAKRQDPTAPPRNSTWLLLWGGVGGWAGVVFLGQLNPFVGDLFSRWLILGAAWLVSMVAGIALWKRSETINAVFVGGAVVALFVNLLAAGGIGIPVVAGSLWGLLALGLNLQESRPCSTLREAGGRLGAFAAACVWVACLGIFVGAVGPYFQAEWAMQEAEEALRATPPAIDKAESAYHRAAAADQYSARPWLALAALDYQAWSSRGAKPSDLRWRKILVNMLKGVDRPRPTNVWSRHRERARIASLLVKQLGNGVSPVELTILRGKVVEASRTAALLYPTYASLRAWLAEASADIGMPGDALKEGKEALRLDGLTPHIDKKLDPEVKRWLENKIPEWEKAAESNPAIAKPK